MAIDLTGQIWFPSNSEQSFINEEIRFDGTWNYVSSKSDTFPASYIFWGPAIQREASLKATDESNIVLENEVSSEDEYTKGMPQPTPLAKEGELPSGFDTSLYGTGSSCLAPMGRWQGCFMVPKSTSSLQRVRETFELKVDDSDDELEVDGPDNEVDVGNVLRVYGVGRNSYGKFTLHGKYHANNGNLVLTRIYYKLPSKRAGRSRASSAQKKKVESEISKISSIGIDESVDESHSERRSKRARTPSLRLDIYKQDPESPRMNSAKQNSSSTHSQKAPTTPISIFSSEISSCSKKSKSPKLPVKCSTPKRNRSSCSFGSARNKSFTESFCGSESLCGSNSNVCVLDSNDVKYGYHGPCYVPAFLDESTGEVYEGGWLKGFRSGVGVCVYANRNIYEGEWRNGKEHGYGLLMKEDRTLIYDGDFSEGRLNGKGTYIFQDGSIYIGEWRDNNRHGRGIHTLPCGSRYEGEWRENVRCGKGLMIWHHGAIYNGEWKDDLKHGKGTLKMCTGYKYTGTWIEDLHDGKGTLIYEDGQKYEGTFKGGVKDGRGKLAFTNGSIYEGRFKNDGIDGQGTLKLTKPVYNLETSMIIPISQVDVELIHVKAGFNKNGN